MWITGIVYGSFFISIFKDKDYKLGWQIQPAFAIGLHKKDLYLLEQIKAFFGVGTIRINKKSGICHYSVLSKKDLNNIIIPHFIKYPLLTQKRADFILFKAVIYLVIKGEHLEGITKNVWVLEHLWIRV